MLRNIILCTLTFCLLSSSFVRGQSSNPCGVVAVMNPGGDSILTSLSVINFQSASINATDYRFIFDIWQYPMNTPINWQIQPGLTTVKLVAYNGSCTDTAVGYYFYSGNFPTPTDNSRRLYGYPARDQEVNNFIGVKAGGYLIAGKRDGSFHWKEVQQGFLIKTKEEGCVDWARKLLTSFGSDISIVKEAADGGFFLLATVVDNSKNFIVKLDAAGNIQWSKILEGPDGSNAVGFGIEALPDGGVAIVGSYPPTAKPVVLRLDNSGNIIWQREYDYNLVFGSANFRNILFKNNFLYIGGSLYANPSTNLDAIITKVDYFTGQTIWTKKYSSPNGQVKLNEILDADSTLLVNVMTGTAQPNTPPIGGYMRLDTSGQVLASSLIAETYIPNTLVGPYNAANTHLIRSGKSFYILSPGSVSLSLQPGISFQTKYIKIDSSYNASWVQASGGAGVPRFFYNASSPKDGLAIAGYEIGTAVSPNYLATLISVKLIDSAGGNPTASCYFGKQAYVVVPLVITPQPIQWISDIPAACSVVQRNFPLVPFYPEMRFKCPDYVDSCSYLKLSGPRSVCNLNDTYTFKTHKNKGCGQPTQWQIPPGTQTISQSDNSVTVRFSAFGRYVIYGRNLLSCTPVEDSIIVIAESKTPPLNLGPDQQICPQNTTILHAGPKYFSYEWHDGSVDSLLRVNAPGQYWVKVMDSCNNILRDTITVSLAPPIPFSIGPDRTKCNNDTIQLHAPAGFLNYSWSPVYNISAANTQNVIVNPLGDTSYTIIAEKTPGCFAYDTIRINVFKSPLISLGNDRSFCQGDSAVLDATGGFVQYSWNTGSTASQLVVDDAGEYAVTAVTNAGCKSFDTLKVLQVFPLPVPLLDPNPVICEGTTRVLDAGAGYAGYLWNNGSSSQTIQVNSTGNYAVGVIDNNGCKGQAAVAISRMQALPAGFLPEDTALCSYGTITLKPTQPYTSYWWSSGSVQSSITISTPGKYWLQVKNNDNCIGKDTIVVHAKDCMKGLFVPSAFTPNGDGKNDEFRPMLFGNIRKYKFTIYNRWGQIVFISTLPGIGWNGRYGGVLQDSHVFIWTCSYELEGEPPKMEKGTVLLVK